MVLKHLIPSQNSFGEQENLSYCFNALTGSVQFQLKYKLNSKYLESLNLIKYFYNHYESEFSLVINVLYGCMEDGRQSSICTMKYKTARTFYPTGTLILSNIFQIEHN